jgi:hypothetical protein
VGSSTFRKHICDNVLKYKFQTLRAEISQSVQRRATDWTTGVRFPTVVRDFSLLDSVQTDFGAHPSSYPMGTGGFFPGVKRPGCEADHSPPSSAEIKNGECIPPLPHASSWRGA